MVAVGNLLFSEVVAVAIGQGFEADPDLHLAERLLRGLEAGKAAGGEVGKNEHSAALVVHDRYPFAVIDLRVDWHDAPITELRRLWGLYEPQMNDFMDRAVKSRRCRPAPHRPLGLRGGILTWTICRKTKSWLM